MRTSCLALAGLLLLSLAAVAGPAVTGGDTSVKGKAEAPPQPLTPDEWRELCLKQLVADKLHALGATVLAENFQKLAAAHAKEVKELKAELKENKGDERAYRYAVALANWYDKLLAAIKLYGQHKQAESMLSLKSSPEQAQQMEELKAARKEVRREVRDLLAQKPKPPK